MEFKSLKNIESSFRQIRLFGIVFLSLCAVITVWSVWSSYRFAERQREKIYVLDNGKSLMLALSQDLSQNRPAEAREHVRRFHELFFTLSPEKSAIEHNVKRALLLADKSVYNYYSDFAEKGYYNRIIAGNINQVLKVDSVVCDFNGYPYRAVTYATQKIIRQSNVTERSLVTTCRLLNSSRSDNNQNGFTIEGVAANMGGSLGSSINISTNAGAQLASDLGKGLIQGTSQYIAKKMRTVKVHLKAGYRVMLYQEVN